MGDLVNPHFVISWSEGDHDDGPSYTVALYTQYEGEPVDFQCPSDTGASAAFDCDLALRSIAADYGLDLEDVKIVWDI